MPPGVPGLPIRLTRYCRLSESPPVPAPDRAGTSEEQGGPRGPEPTRYGDWEKKGLAIDF